MTEPEKKEIKKVEGSVSVAKKPTPQQKGKSVNKNAKKAQKRVVGKPFTSEYQPNNKCGGRPIQQFSYRAMAKVRAGKDPARVEKDLDVLDKILDSESATPMEKMKAMELKIKLNGGFDPVENKDVTPKTISESPLNGLTIEELRSLKVLKKAKK